MSTASTRTETPSDPPPADRPRPPADQFVTTHHTLTLDGSLPGTTAGALRYRAVTGRLVLREEVYDDGVFAGHKPKAEVSFTSYTLDDADPATRPVVFSFNGGPGSASLWLHLGLLGPRRIEMGDVGDLKPPPYAIVDNPQSLLAVADLVFIDPVSTGYSRVAEGDKADSYHSYEKDVESVSEIIRYWTHRHQRWMSPKFLIGESYGTLRAAAVGDRLQSRHGLYLNGIMLISSVLDLDSVAWGERRRNDRACVGYLPTYAAIAHYHGKIPGRTLDEVVREAEEFADGPYVSALALGHRLDEQRFDETAATLSRLTGLDVDYVRRSNLRIEHTRFFAELRRDEGLLVGRLDSRFTSPAVTGIQEQALEDPSYAASLGPYAAAINHYVAAELGYVADLPYEVISPRTRPWSYQPFEGRPIDVSEHLERAMRHNRHLQVHVAYGYYDGATPHHAAEDVIAHLEIPRELRDNIEHRYYEGGHMMYIHEPSRLQQSADLADFVRRAAGRDVSAGQATR